MEGYLENKGLWTQELKEKMAGELEEEVVSTFEEIEGKADTEIEDIFRYHFETMPPQLKEQLDEYQSYLREEEA